MDELMDMILSDESPSQITDTIKDLLFAKSAEKVDAFKPVVANYYLETGEEEVENESPEVETDPQEDEE